MKILIVCSRNSGRLAPFISEQAESLERVGCEVDFYCIERKGLWGYLKSLKGLKKAIATFSPDIIHAHYGLSGLLANLQRKVPVVTTYHGSDIHLPTVYFFSKMSMMLSAYNIFVSAANSQKSGLKKNYSIIPCGVNLTLFHPIDQKLAREHLGWENDQKVVLFAGAFNNPVKNPNLAIQVLKKMHDVQLIELQGYQRDEVALLLNAVVVVLMTSFTEGSPQVIKEALACNCPVVSVPVGDVPNLIQDIEGCYITSNDELDIVDKLGKVFVGNRISNGANRLLEMGLDLENIASRIKAVYNKVIYKC